MTSELSRLWDWRSRFANECDRIQSKPFSWDGHECGIGLAGNLVLALTGEDLIEQYRGSYTTEEEALQVMKAAGFASVGDFVGSFLPEYAHPSEAQIGDIVAIDVDNDFKHALGIVNGERIYILTEHGFGTLRRSKASRAFKVG